MTNSVILVHVDLLGITSADFDEFRILAKSAGASVLSEVTAKKSKPDPKYFIGSGKAESIQALVKQLDIDVVMFNHSLTPAQERNLETMLQCRVLDRTGLILDIFAQRARTFEGKLQVELAQLQHMATRLVRGWTHLERQKGGIGLRGPGETQLETDRRLLRERIKYINQRLSKVKQQRELSRRARKRSSLATLSLVGYTNAGKSTLFNRLTNANVYVADQLFATLDPTLRKIPIPYVGEAIVADTVGFIRHLPHGLVEAFHATLEETQQADLLLHIVDVHDAGRRDNMAAVNAVLNEIDADGVPQLVIYNKIDLNAEKARIDRDELGKPKRVWLSAVTGEGMDLLEQAISDCLLIQRVHCCMRLKPVEAKLRAWLHEHQAIVQEEFADNGDCLVEIMLPLRLFNQLMI